ncbi:hypothetical protein FIBSPDRAFT_947513 [Athelia psychrophila]|uniref:HNH nuclease domain-containing protein n=1 Tax=Athelia psychrophila TaxID=1759441 RepID=A0A166RV31_9AGAM|nr:hypothetical protein FIBSPDRAFT_947513 [Fibularhizoctonia sp. CBS 109695]
MKNRRESVGDHATRTQCLTMHLSSQPPPGFIHLVLLSQADPFYLEIPTKIVKTLCLRPLKFLRYLGWCVLGVEGDLVDEGGNKIALDGELLGQGVYHYTVSNEIILAHAVDLEVIKHQSQVPSDTTGTREDFRTKVSERDGCCVWVGIKGAGMHIIPYARGDEACSHYSCPGMRAKFNILPQWLQLIINNRPHNENLDSLSINAIRNGICADINICHHYFGRRDAVVLKTPNPILETTDVPERYERKILYTNVSYPSDSRYTFQWIATMEHQITLDRYPNNNDATFMNQQLAKPADLLLHYNYGAAAVKQWGKNSKVLADRPDIPCPSGPAPAPKERNTSKGAAADFEAQEFWDEDDVMLYLWGNTKAAQDRHAQKEQERTASLENWRDAVTAETGL